MDAICLGELLIDFVCPDADVSLAEAQRFAKAPGGAPANVAVGLAKLGLSSGFVGCVGADPFGDFLVQTVAEQGVDVTHLLRAAEARTTLAFVASHRDGRKDITFYRDPGADMMLSPADLDAAWLGAARLFHFCSVSLSREPARSATLEAARLAKAGGAVISFDPNWRAPLWPSVTEAVALIQEGLALADVVKVADEELRVVCDTDDPEDGLDRLLAAGPRLAVMTFGADGAAAATADHRVRVPGFHVHAVDALGAGDAFVAAMLSRLLAQGDLSPSGLSPSGLSPSADDLRDMLTYANAAGALATRTVGVIPALPTAPAVDAFVAAATEAA